VAAAGLPGSAAADEEVPVRRSASRTRQVIQAVVSGALVVFIFGYVLPRVADFSEVWAAIRDMTPTEITTLSLAGLWNLATYWLIWMAVLPGLRMRQAAVSTEASTAIANTVPGGSYLAVGLNYSMIHSWGFRRSIVTLALLISGVWNNFAKLALPVIALAALAVQGQVTGGRVVAASLGVVALVATVVLFAYALRSNEAAERIGNGAARAAAVPLRLLKRPEPFGWDIALVRFRQKTIGLLRQRWWMITLATIVGHLSLYLVLLLALRHLGVSNDEVPWAEVLAVFAFSRLITAVPLTPGGLGVMELALTTGLVAAGGNREEVVAAVLVYRFLTYVVPIPLGVACYFFWRANTSWRHAPEVVVPAAAA
jgi:putative heme transporter